MAHPQRLARIAGALYLVTFVTSIPALLLKAPVLDDPDFILGAGSVDGVLWAGLLEVLLAFACIGTALALYPVVRRHSEPAALGFLASRGLEAAVIVGGVLSLLTVVTLRQDLAGAAGADPSMLVTTGAALVAVHDWTFLLGPGLLPAVNAVLLGWALFRTRLVPRSIPAVGLVGAPLLAGSAAAILFGVFEQVSFIAALLAFPIALWELAIGLWLVTRGFQRDALGRLVSTPDRPAPPTPASPSPAPAGSS